MVTGKNSAKASGALGQTLQLFNKLNIDYVLYDQVGANPTIKMVQQGADLGQQAGCDFVFAIGGGSPIDAAKAMAVCLSAGIKAQDVYNFDLWSSALPLVAVPTTSGTGTEATPYSVLTNMQTGKKAGFGSPHIFPQLSFCDPAFTLSLSPEVTRDTAIDALSHLLEGLYSNKRNPLMYPFIYAGVELIYRNLPLSLQDPTNLAARTALMQASLYGGMVISHTSTTLQHSIGYPLTTEYGISHGLANGLVMQQIMELYQPHVQQELKQLFAHLGISQNDFYSWLKQLNLTSPVSISQSFIDNAVPQVQQSRNMALNPCAITAQQIEQLYKSI